jgi:hypothetical protein
MILIAWRRNTPPPPLERAVLFNHYKRRSFLVPSPPLLINSKSTFYRQKLTVWQRILGDTPAFFKRLQVFAVGLAGLGGTLATIHGIPAGLTTSLISAGTAIAAIAQFAVKMDETNSADPCSNASDKPTPSETV